MKIQFISRWDAKKLIETGDIYNVNLISISDNHDERVEMETLWLKNFESKGDAKFYSFADVDDTTSGFTNDIAKSMVEFAQHSFDTKSDMIVHCFAGISRSGAVAKFINEHFMLGERYLEEYNGHNRYIYNMLLDNSGTETLRNYYRGMEKSHE